MLSGLLKFHRIDHDFSDLWGSYNRPTNPRNVPSDAAIAQMRDAIENEGHQLAFGLMAAYGLRNHELNCIERFDDDGAITITGGKSGDRHIRKVWPLYPDWFQEWGLGELDRLPDWSGPHNAAIGARVTQVFARSPVISCTPYDLRHAWALRAIEYGLPVELAAIQMGHSLEVHTETYQFWLDSDRQRRVAERLKQRSDRPRPPKVA